MTILVLVLAVAGCPSAPPPPAGYGDIAFGDVVVRARLCMTYKDRVGCFQNGYAVDGLNGILMPCVGEESRFVCDPGNPAPVVAVFFGADGVVDSVHKVPVMSEELFLPSSPPSYLAYLSPDVVAQAKIVKGSVASVPREASSELADAGTVDVSFGKNGTVESEIVDTAELRQRGLMYRKTMPSDHGMLFVYQEENEPGFWMKNTRLPLSIAFMKQDGTIVDIQDRQPGDLSSKGPGEKVIYVLETNQGWFAKHGIKPGDKASIPDLGKRK